jgi:predicted nuclease of predicted toxin-antitoxin system
VKLLFDQNLSPDLPHHLADLFPDSIHVRSINLAKADDIDVWEFSRAGGYAIVSKDEDFRQLSLVRGSPPHVVWLRLGNCSTAGVEQSIRLHSKQIAKMEGDASILLLVITPAAAYGVVRSIP